VINLILLATSENIQPSDKLIINNKEYLINSVAAVDKNYTSISIIAI